MSREKVEQIKRLLKELSAEEREAILKEVEEPAIPVFVWNSNLNGFKAALKYIESHGEVNLVALKNHLRRLGYVQDESEKFNYGIVYNETGIFRVDPKSSVVGLTSIGRELATLFNEDHENLTIIEKVLCRGLQQQSAGYTFLHIVGQNPRILREKLQEKLVELYGAKGKYYTGYCIRLFDQLDLIRKKREGRKMSYYLTVPEAWWQEPPKFEEEE